MREIKFRIWDKATDEYEYTDEGFQLIFSNLLKNKLNIISANKYLVIEQFTGLYDKSSKEIYENDIVHFNANGLSGLGIVFWEQSTCQFAIKDIRRGRTDRTYPFWEEQKYVVKGNIHENKDLVEVSE